LFAVRRREFTAMQGEDIEKWQKLCQVAVEEHDHLRLMELIREIDRMLLEKELRIQSTKAKGRPRAA